MRARTSSCNHMRLRLIIFTLLVLGAVAIFSSLQRKHDKVDKNGASPTKDAKEELVPTPDSDQSALLQKGPLIAPPQQDIYANTFERFSYRLPFIKPEYIDSNRGFGYCYPGEKECQEKFDASKYFIKQYTIDGNLEIQFIPVENKLYEIPIWAIHSTSYDKLILKIKAGEDLGSPWSSRVYSDSTSLPFYPKTACNVAKFVRAYNPYSCKPYSYRARGNIKLGIIEFMLPNTKLPAAFGKNYADYLNDSRQTYSLCVLNYDNNCAPGNATNTHYSFRYLNKFYKEEAIKHKFSDINFEISTFGPFKIPSIPRYGYDRDMRYLNKLFREASKTNGVNLDKFDLLAFVFFDDLRETPKKYAFVSTVYENAAFINIVGIEPTVVDGKEVWFLPNGDTDVETLIHELGHVLGADDKYSLVSPGSIATTCRREGLGDPDKKPLFPQETADVYCGKIFETKEAFENPKGGSDGTYQAVLNSDINAKGRLVINRYTAKELGWID